MRYAAALILLAATSGQAREVRKPTEHPREHAPVVQFDPAEATRQIRAHMGAVRACYERAARREPGLRGKLQLGFDISEAGSVAATNVETDALKADADWTMPASLTRCIRQQALSWQLAPEGPVGGAHVSYVFVFERSY